MMPPWPMPGALMIAGLTFPWVAVQPAAHGFPAGSAATALSTSGSIAGVTCAAAPVRLSRSTSSAEGASTVDPAAATAVSPSPSPAGAWVQAVPFHRAAYELVQTPPSPQEKSRAPTAHSPAAVLARPVIWRPDCAGTGGAGSSVQVVPSDWATWSPPAIQTCPAVTATVSSAPMSVTFTCRQVLPF